MAHAILLSILLAAGCARLGFDLGARDPDLAALETAVAAWRQDPGPIALGPVIDAVERAMAVEEPSPALEIRLGDALSNVLLRPELGVPYLERHRHRLTADDFEAWLDALLRHHDLFRFQAEAQRLVHDLPIDVEHPTLESMALQAQFRHAVGWREVIEAYRAARLAEGTVGDAGLREIDRPVEDFPALGEVLGMLFDDEVELLTMRSTNVDDGDPMLKLGAVMTMNDRRRVEDYVRSSELAMLRRPGEALVQKRPPRLASISANVPTPYGRIEIGIDGRLQDQVFLPIRTNDPRRATTWILAAEDLSDGRAKGRSDAEIARDVRARWREAFLHGH